jgi:putative ABC transport system permease protein
VHSRLRSWLAIIDIVSRIVAVVAIVSIGEGMQQNVESRLGGFGADIITITSGATRLEGGNTAGSWGVEKYYDFYQR